MRKILTYFALTVFVVQCQTQRRPCRRPNNHCDCSNPGDITCVNINTIPRNLPRNTTYLSLAGNFFGSTLIKQQVDRLAPLNLRQLDLSRNRLEIVEDRAFELLYRLQVLDISSNNIQTLSDNTFVGLKSLAYLYANDAGIEHLSFRVFESVPNLLYVDLEDNKLTSIGREFSTLTSLNTILLAENQISMISRLAFSGLTQLSHLSLLGNKLSLPYSSWFRDLIENDGNIELDRRITPNETSPVNEPNKWLCCQDAAQYHNFLINLEENVLKSHPQLDVSCSWPVQLSGRLMSSLTSDEINSVSCGDYSKPTTPYAFLKSAPASTTTEGAQIEPIPEDNFLSTLNDAGAFFILLLVAAIGGVLVGGCCFCYRTKKGKQKIHAIINVFRPGFADSSSEKTETELKTRPYRQETPFYGPADPAERQKSAQKVRPPRPPRPAPPAPRSPPSGQHATYSSVVKPAKKSYSNYTMETDQSEEEVWSKGENKRRSHI